MASNSNFNVRSMQRRNIKGLGLNAAKPKEEAPVPSGSDSQIPGAIGNDNRTDTLEIGVEFHLALESDDLVVLKELGAGNGGTVSKVMHSATKQIMARKIIHVEAKKEVRKRIVRELGIMHECNSPYIVDFYGAFMNASGDVVMCMEYMDVGSLDMISKSFGPVRVDILGKIAVAVLGGLTYLYSAHKIMHRDIKPQNILVNSKGQIKLIDFGVSSELENSVADTFVGTGTYMAPERIQGSPYTVKSDVWSVGLTLMELAIGKFPFNVDADAEDPEEPAGPQGILDLLQQIVLEPSPRLPKSSAFPPILEKMIEKCLMKDPAQRPTPQEIFEQDSFLQAAKRTPVNLGEWAVDMMVAQNRKSHLFNQPAASTPGTANTLTNTTATPTANPADIPMANLSISTDRPASGSLDTRPFPVRTTSANRISTADQQQLSPSQNGSGTLPSRSAPPAGPLPDLPRRQSSMQSPMDVDGQERYTHYSNDANTNGAHSAGPYGNYHTNGGRYY